MMKQLKKNIKWILIPLLAILFTMCIWIDNITQPTTAPIDSEINVSIDLRVKEGALFGGNWTSNENKKNGITNRIVIGILAPTSWNISSSAKVTYTTAGRVGEEITAGATTLISTDEIEPFTGVRDIYTPLADLTWAQAATKEVGVFNNYQPVEWVFFKGDIATIIEDAEEFAGVINIKMTVGSENVKANLGYFVGNDFDGVRIADNYCAFDYRTIETTGGDNDLIDYSKPIIVTTAPASFTWDDMMAVQYDASVKYNNVPSLLNDADNVYLYGKMFFAEGADSVVVDEISSKTQMRQTVDGQWQLYIHPKSFFGLPPEALVSKVVFHFTDGENIVKEPSSNTDFEVKASCE